MKPPSPNQLNEFNRVLIAVTELASEEKGCSIGSVNDLCSSVTLGGRPVDHRAVLRLCQHAGLLSVNGSTIRLTGLGQMFLQDNPDRFYEITETQRRFIAERLVFQGPWRAREGVCSLVSTRTTLR